MVAVHLCGAFMTFGLGTVYELVQTVITYKMHPEINGKGIFIARLIISLLSFSFFISGLFYVTKRQQHENL